MNLKRILTVIACLTAVQFSASAADVAAEWAKEEKANLDKINRESLVAIAKGAPDSYAKLFAEVKPDYKSSPLELTRIAALTQFMASCGNMAECNKYADALVKAAKGATAGDVTCFFLDQLRWCATPKQTAEIKSFESSTQTGVAALATIAALASERNFDSLRVVDTKTACTEYGEMLSKLQGSQKTKALLAGFDNPDLKIAGLAMREASQLDIQDTIEGMGRRKADEINKRRFAAGQEETMVFALKMKNTTDPIRKTMLLDMLGKRGNPAAVEAVAECIGDADIMISAAAQNALTKISPEAYANALPAMLKNLPQSHAAVTEQTLMLLPGKLIESALLKDYDSYSLAGKDIVLNVLKNRKSKSGITLALAAIDGRAAESAVSGYRLLRDCATEKEADVLIKQLLKESGKRLQEAQSAVAGAARRDTTGSYITKLGEAFKQASGTKKQSVLETFGRIGSKPLLALAESAVKDADTEISTAAVRALAEWSDNDSVKALMSIALMSADNKQRILAQRGLEKKLAAKGVDKAPFKKLWEEISKGDQGDAEIKKQINALFGQ
ncbi:MAG: hypothetical protein PHO37_08110 [Kiritimatiellae bacterium]|nr:hypothetical protein [Kiritimatiellia bacterium]